MSEKQQHTACRTRETMLHRYDDGLHHKHDKSHLPYRQHCRSHPVVISTAATEEKQINDSTGLIRKRNLQKIRKRFDKERVH